jgi:hypothetical protein
MVRMPVQVAALVCALVLVAGCGSDKGDSDNKSAQAQVLDPAQKHYGRTYSEWNAAWFKWIYELPLDDSCALPTDDSTGEHCDSAQPDDVFFLAGAPGLNNKQLVRDQCIVSAHKPIFFPIMNTVADNGGVPTEHQLSDADNEASAVGVVNQVQPKNLFASVDGEDVPDLASFKTDIVEFSYVVPEEPNFYSCQGAPGVTGEIGPSYAGGYYVMLAPLSAGRHDIRFGLHQPDDLWSMDVTYHLTVR